MSWAKAHDHMYRYEDTEEIIAATTPTRDVDPFLPPKADGCGCKKFDISCWLVVAMVTSLAKTYGHMYIACTAAQRYRSLAKRL